MTQPIATALARRRTSTRSAATTCRRATSGRSCVRPARAATTPSGSTAPPSCSTTTSPGSAPTGRACARAGGATWTYGELRARANQIAARAHRRPRARARQPRAAARAEQPVAGGVLVRRAQGRRRRGHDHAAAAPAASCATIAEIAPAGDRAVRPPLPDDLARRDASPALRHRGLRRRRRPTTWPPRAAARPTAFAAVDTAADDVALLAFTSGTTGRPKATMHFHRDVLAIADTFSRARAAARGPTTSSPARRRSAFTFGLGGLVVFPLRVGRARRCCSSGATPGRARRRRRRARRHRAVHRAHRLPRHARRRPGRPAAPACAAPSRPGSRCPASRLARRPRRDRRADHRRHRLHRDAARLHLRRRRRHPPGLHRPRRARLPRRRRSTTTGRPVPDGTPGRLAVKGPTGCRYLAGDRQEIYVRHGWNLTGDTYVRDADGYFWYQARSDDMIVSSGYNIAGPGGRAGAARPPRRRRVRGRRRARRRARARSSRRTSCCARAPPPTTRGAELQELVKATIAPYKYPRAVEFVDELPRDQPPASCSAYRAARSSSRSQRLRAGRDGERDAHRGHRRRARRAVLRRAGQAARPGARDHRLGAQRRRRHVRLRRRVLRRDARRDRARRPARSSRDAAPHFARWDDIDVHFRGTRHHLRRARVRRDEPQGAAADPAASAAPSSASTVHFRTPGARPSTQLRADVRPGRRRATAPTPRSAPRTPTCSGPTLETAPHAGTCGWAPTRSSTRSRSTSRETPHGVMQVHGYPYDADGQHVHRRDARRRLAGGRLRRRRRPADLPPGESDDEVDRAGRASSSPTCSAARAAGEQLASGCSFPTVRNETWRHGNVVLLGDAAHTAHFSIGSGTKLAMEDALALAACLHEQPDARRRAGRLRGRAPPGRGVHAARRAGQPGVVREHRPVRRTRSPPQFAFNILTRSRRVTHDNLRLRDPEFVAAVDAVVRRPQPARRAVAAADVPALPAGRAGAAQPRRRLADGHVLRRRRACPATSTWSTWAARRSAAPALVMTEMVCVSAEGRITPGLHRPLHAGAGGGVAPRRRLRARTSARARSASSSGTPGARARPSSCGRASTSRCPTATGTSSARPPLPYSPAQPGAARADRGRARRDRATSSSPRRGRGAAPASTCSSCTARTATCCRRSSPR